MNNRHQVRVDWHDYNDGTYFVTICTSEKRCIFGNIQDDKINLSALGLIIKNCIDRIPRHNPDTAVLNSVVMPNHVHLVLSIMPPVGAQNFAPTSSLGCLKPPKHGTPCCDNHFNSRLAVVIRTFKAACSRLYSQSLRAQYIAPLQPIWQRNYHEHIIRTRRSFDHIMAYIDNNVSSWGNDCFNR